MSEQVPTAARPQFFPIKAGGSVGVRRIAAHIRNDLYAMAAKGLEDEGAIGLKFAELCTRWGIVTADEVPNPSYKTGDDDHAQYLSADRKPEGRYQLVSRELYSAAAADDGQAGEILNAIMGTAPSEDLAGKQSSSPGGSTKKPADAKTDSRKPKAD